MHLNFHIPHILNDNFKSSWFLEYFIDISFDGHYVLINNTKMK